MPDRVCVPATAGCAESRSPQSCVGDDGGAEYANHWEEAMKSALTFCIGVALLTVTASTADAWRAATGPRGGAAVAGPRGAAVRGPGGNVAVAGRGYGGTSVYRGGAYYSGRPYYGAGAVAAGVAVGAAAGAATTSAYYATTPYYNPYYPY